MGILVLLLVVAQTPTDVERFTAALQDPGRRVRDAALWRAAAEDAPATHELAALLDHADPRVVAGTCTVLEARGDAAAMPALATRAAGKDSERGTAAARALVFLAMQHRRPLAAYADRVPAVRLEAAFDRLAERYWSTLRGSPRLDYPQRYRFVMPGGVFAERWLSARFGDGRRPAFDRAHAVHAYTRLVGARAAPALDRLLDDPSPTVRLAAAALIVRYRVPPGLQRLAAWLESDRIVGAAERAQAMAAASATGTLGPRGRATLRRAIVDRPLGEALRAARLLKRLAPDEARPAIRARVDLIFTRRRVGRGGGVAAVLFELAVGPLDDDQRAILAAAKEPLMRAAVAGRKESLARLEPLLAPRHFKGAVEMIRIDAISQLLRRHDAPAEMRRTFAAAALRRPGTLMRRQALATLAGLPRAELAPLDDAIGQTLFDAAESIRVAGALLRGPGDAVARDVLLDAIYDGDPRYGARAARALAARPDGPRIDPAAAIVDRRAGVMAVPRDKE